MRALGPDAILVDRASALQLLEALDFKNSEDRERFLVPWMRVLRDELRTAATAFVYADAHDIWQEMLSSARLPHDLVDTAEAARILRCGEPNVRHLVRKGRIDAERIGGRWLVHRSDLERFRTRRTR